LTALTINYYEPAMPDIIDVMLIDFKENVKESNMSKYYFLIDHISEMVSSTRENESPTLCVGC
jgi:hypothetical protein